MYHLSFIKYYFLFGFKLYKKVNFLVMFSLFDFFVCVTLLHTKFLVCIAFCAPLHMVRRPCFDGNINRKCVQPIELNMV